MTTATKTTKKTSAGASRKRTTTGASQSAAKRPSAKRQSQGADTARPTPMFGGSKQVLIEEVAMGSRGGRKQGVETYPFGDLEPSRIVEGSIVGPSFFIPESESPKTLIAAARKRHKPAGKIFLTRQMNGKPVGSEQEVPGTRVWLSPEKAN